MSLHATLSPEAQQRLQSQRRTSTISSVIIALLATIFVALILLIIGIASGGGTMTQLETYKGEALVDKPLQRPTLKIEVSRKPSSPNRSMSKTIVADTSAPLAIPVPELDTPKTNVAFGSDGDFGEGLYGNGPGTIGNFNNIPGVMKKRCSQADRLQRLQESGGTPECDTAVIKALRFLNKTQNNDGSWTSQQPVGMTGLALLAYLGHCETAQSEEFGEAVLAAITYLVDVSMKNNGKLASDFKNEHWCYEHAIATYALGEALILTRAFGENIAQLEEAVLASGQFLINSQHTGGGWDYGYSEDSQRGGDLSIVGWHLQALKACKQSGLEFKNLRSCAKKALAYVEFCQLDSGAMGYSGPVINGERDGTSLAAVGALSTQIWDASSRVATKACRFIDQEMKFDWNTADSDLYGHYYASQAMINHGGEEWKRYNQLFISQVLPNQSDDGSFKPVAKGGKVNAPGSSFAGNNTFATHYRTCLSTLMLEVYYRFLPATGGR